MWRRYNANWKIFQYNFYITARITPHITPVWYNIHIIMRRIYQAGVFLCTHDDRENQTQGGNHERTTALWSANRRQPPVLYGETDRRGHTSDLKIRRERNPYSLYGHTETCRYGEKTENRSSKIMTVTEETTECMFPRRGQSPYISISSANERYRYTE